MAEQYPTTCGEICLYRPGNGDRRLCPARAVRSDVDGAPDEFSAPRNRTRTTGGREEPWKLSEQFANSCTTGDGRDNASVNTMRPRKRERAELVSDDASTDEDDASSLAPPAKSPRTSSPLCEYEDSIADECRRVRFAPGTKEHDGLEPVHAMFDRFIWSLVTSGPLIQYWTEDFIFDAYAGGDVGALEELLRLTRDLDYRVELHCQPGVQDCPGAPSAATAPPGSTRFVPILVGGGGSAGKLGHAHLPILRYGKALLERTVRCQQSRRTALRRQRFATSHSHPAGVSVSPQRHSAVEAYLANPLTAWWEPRSWMTPGQDEDQPATSVAFMGLDEADGGDVPCVSPLQLDFAC